MAVDPDRIETNLMIAAPLERVWELITTPEHVGRWFADAGAEIDLRPGGALSLTWREHGRFNGRVEAVERPRRFAFRWLSQIESTAEPRVGNSTLAEFVLSAEGDGTRLAVIESGFASLEGDPAARTAALKSHTTGWVDELGELAAYATGTAAGR